MPRLLTVSLFILSATVFAQKIQLINSGEVIENAKTLYDSEKYEIAIKNFLTVPERDTNYVYMLSELALAYTGNKEYDKALETCEKALKNPGSFRAHLLKTEAITLDRKGELDKSIAAFKSAIAKYPFDHSLRYNLGVTYSNNKEYEKAEDCFFQVLSFNPYHAGSHLNLAKMSLNQGLKTHAMMAYGIYLAIRSSDNSQLVMLNNMLGNQVPEEGKMPVVDKNAAGKIDQILKAKLAMEKSFETKVPIDAFVTRQFEMLFSQLSTLPATSDDRYLNYYLNIYQVINEKNLVEPFLYHLLTSADNPVAKKWRGKNEKSLNSFFDQVNTTLKAKREIVDGKNFGFTGPINAWYDDNHLLDGMGKKTGEIRQGRWVYFYNNQEKSAEGNYDDKGNKAGPWIYYYNTGIIKSLEDETTGEVTMNFEDGKIQQHFFLKTDLIEGEAKVYYPSGQLQHQYNYTQGKRNGESKTFFTSGKLTSVAPYSMGLYNGEVVFYFENGKVETRTMYKNGKLEGRFIAYHANGKVKTEGINANDQAVGVWKYFYSTGRLEKTGSYTNGFGVGDWTFYDARGRISEKRTLDEQGKFQGEDTYFKNGKKHFVQHYKKDMLIKVVYYDTTGKEIWQGGKSDGTFAVKRFFNTGELFSEGNLKKGVTQGKWKYYKRDGKLFSEYNYTDGQIQGEAIEYHPTGGKKYIFNYVDDKLHGYFQELYPDGTIKQEGWYQNNNREQQWLSYFPNGKVESDYYYLFGEYTGPCLYYSLSGKVASITTYKNNRIIDMQNFDSKGAQKIIKTESKNIVVMESKFANNKSRFKYELINGDYVNAINKWFPDGSLFYTYPLMDGNKHGEYKYFDVTGKVLVSGQYLNNLEQGPWQYFTDEGVTSRSGFYLDGETDSVWTYYHPNGKISSTAVFLEKEREGVSKYYTPEGSPMMEKLYSSGDLISFRTRKQGGSWTDWTKFTPDAKIAAHDDAGKIIYEETYKNSLRDGTWRLYYANGNKSYEYQYKDGDYNGPFVVYHANGKVRRKGQYLNDDLDGKIESYNEDGTLRKTEFYQFGNHHGVTTLYTKGVKTKEFTFYDDMIE